MADLHSLVDRIFYANRREYTVQKGEIAYLDSKPLRRPFSMPLAQRIIALVIVCAAIAIGGVFINNTILDSFRAAEKAEKAIEENLNREASIKSIPKMDSIILKSDDDIKTMFKEAGYTTYDITSQSESNSLVLWKLPSDVSTDDAAVMLSQGVNKLSAEQASRLLNGSWRLSVDRINGTSMVVHYADFTTADPEVAIRNAIDAEGFSLDSVEESGVDESGNSFTKGTLEVDDTPCSWSISALPLDEIYSIAGLTEKACYVGVRVTVL